MGSEADIRRLGQSDERYSDAGDESHHQAGDQDIDPNVDHMGPSSDPAGSAPSDHAGDDAGDEAGDEAGATDVEYAGSSAGEMAGEMADEIAGDTAEMNAAPTERLGAVFAHYADDHWDELKEISLGQITSGTDCVTFVSAALRVFSFDIWAMYTDGLGPGDLPEQTLAYRLFELGFERFDDAQLLRAGDICFSQDAYYDGVAAIMCDYPVSDRDGWFPTHTYIFMEWEVAGSTAWAWVVDNQGQRHLRNMTVAGPRDMFQYFMRYRESRAP